MIELETIKPRFCCKFCDKIIKPNMNIACICVVGNTFIESDILKRSCKLFSSSWVQLHDFQDKEGGSCCHGWSKTKMKICLLSNFWPEMSLLCTLHVIMLTRFWLSLIKTPNNWLIVDEITGKKMLILSFTSINILFWTSRLFILDVLKVFYKSNIFTLS